jgi:hypothetical protein
MAKKNKKDNLENYYSGDAIWNNLVKIFKDDFLNDIKNKKDFLQKVKGDLDLAVVIYGKLGEYGYKWIDSKTPALGGLSPTQCLESEKLILRLRECLLRM